MAPKQSLNVIFSLYSKMNQDERDDLTQEDTAGLVKGTWTFYLKPVQVITDYLMTGSSKVSSFLALATNLARLEARRRSATWTPTQSYGSREVFVMELNSDVVKYRYVRLQSDKIPRTVGFVSGSSSVVPTFLHSALLPRQAGGTLRKSAHNLCVQCILSRSIYQLTCN